MTEMRASGRGTRAATNKVPTPPLRLSGLLEEARARGRGLGAFTCYDLETASGVLRAALALDAPVTLLVSARSLSGAEGQALVAGLHRLVTSSGARACVELDHLEGPPGPEALDAFEPEAVMVDGSALDLGSNLTMTREAVARLAPFGGEVEGEVGRLEGDEDLALETAGGNLTDPVEAERYVRETGVVCLAVAVGNAHGPYRRPPVLAFDLLAELAARVPAPLALHGASGLSVDDLRRAVASGATKVNFNADLRAATLSALEEGAHEAREQLDLLGLKARVVASVEAVASSKLAMLGWNSS